MFSISTMASSTRMPTTSVMPSRLTRLSEKPIMSIAQKVGMTDSGSAIAETSVARQSRRKMSTTMTASSGALDQRLHRRIVVAVGVVDRVVDLADGDVGMRCLQLRDRLPRRAVDVDVALRPCRGRCRTTPPVWPLTRAKVFGSSQASVTVAISRQRDAAAAAERDLELLRGRPASWRRRACGSPGRGRRNRRGRRSGRHWPRAARG